MGSPFEVEVPVDIPDEVTLKEVDGGPVISTVALQALLELFDRYEREFDCNWGEFGNLFSTMIGMENCSHTQFLVIRAQVENIVAGPSKKNMKLLKMVSQEVELVSPPKEQGSLSGLEPSLAGISQKEEK